MNDLQDPDLRIVKFCDNRKIEIVHAKNIEEAFNAVKKTYPSLKLSDIDAVYKYFKNFDINNK